MRIGLLLALAASLIACRWRAPSQQGHEHPAPADVAPVSRALFHRQRHGPRLSSQGWAASYETPFRRSTAFFQRRPCSLQIIATADNRNERLAWLARDFHTPVFLRAERLDEARIMEEEPDPLHVGVLAVRFSDCRSLAEAKAKSNAAADRISHCQS